VKRLERRETLGQFLLRRRARFVGLDPVDLRAAVEGRPVEWKLRVAVQGNKAGEDRSLVLAVRLSSELLEDERGDQLTAAMLEQVAQHHERLAAEEGGDDAEA
jgi:hypothetical protein